MDKMITEEERAEILQILKDGERKDAHCRMRPSEETIFLALYRYAQMKGMLHKFWKLKYFRKAKGKFPYSASDNYHPYCDCPLSRGQILVAIRYGHQNGFLEGVSSRSNRRWRFNGRCKSLLKNQSG